MGSKFCVGVFFCWQVCVFHEYEGKFFVLFWFGGIVYAVCELDA